LRLNQKPGIFDRPLPIVGDIHTFAHGFEVNVDWDAFVRLECPFVHPDDYLGELLFG
jgi:hypothetical protein